MREMIARTAIAATDYRQQQLARPQKMSQPTSTAQRAHHKTFMRAVLPKLHPYKMRAFLSAQIASLSKRRMHGRVAYHEGANIA
jgi:hypothetical protein